MLKITGAILLVLGTTGVGISFASDMKKRLYHIRYLYHIFSLLLSEIGYAKASIEEACRTVSDKVQRPYRQFLEQIYEKMKANTGEAFAELWKHAMQAHLSELPLKKADWKILEEFADYTGYMDIDLQKQVITYKLQDLEKLILQIEEETAKQSKLYLTLGFMSGVFLTIVLL
ncbi:MAG: stage III sporulation protein AB [Lachnospiraceae bacterium]|nr:stage III sporulation protein AB [Lachnospiraceae bacterium]